MGIWDEICQFKRSLRNKIKTKSLKTKSLKTKSLIVDDHFNYENINYGQYTFRLRNNGLEVVARDRNGDLLTGVVPLQYLHVPLVHPISNNTIIADISKPYKVVYIDQPDYWWPMEKMAQTFYDAVDVGFNVLILAFLVNGQPADMANAWSTQLNAINPDTNKEYRQEILDYAHSKGAVILVSTGGATETDYWNTDPEKYGTTVANFAKTNLFDGVDFDLEHFSPGLTLPNKTSQETIDWLVTVTNTTRNILGDGAIITHAPQAPYFGKFGSNVSWAGPLGGYTAVDKATTIDFYNVQCYNQQECYTDYNGIFIESCSLFPDSSFEQIGMDLNKFVLGKPMRKDIDAGSGYNTPEEINSILLEAKDKLNYTTGLMTWQWPYRDSNNPPEDGKSIAGPWLEISTENW